MSQLGPCRDAGDPTAQSRLPREGGPQGSMEMLVGEQKQDGVALLLDPAGRRSLISPFRISRKCRMCVVAKATRVGCLGLAGACL